MARLHAENAANLIANVKHQRLAVCGVETRYRDAKPYDIFAQYAQGFAGHRKNGVGMIFIGRRGSGKTWAASAIVSYLAPDWDVRIITSSGLMREIKATFGTPTSEEDVIRKYVAFDLLAIDDLGKEQATEWSLSQFFSIIDRRYSQVKPTLITTQLSDDELIARWESVGGARAGRDILSRVYQDGIRISMNDIDRRAS
jgi:DNA replication protein DnaC